MILVSGATATVAEWAGHPRLGRLLRPGNGNRPDGLPWAVDNGAFKNFDERAFEVLLDRLANLPGCLWVAAPDVVADHAATLERFAKWEATLHWLGFPVAFVLQDGCDVASVPWESLEAVFVGGSTEFKQSERARELVARARQLGKRAHMGRVNTARRMRIAHQFGCDTIDGTAFSRYPDIKIPWALSALSGIELQRPLFASPAHPRPAPRER
jgi:hypothetical protein